jgi:hypothetical protein
MTTTGQLQIEKPKEAPPIAKVSQLDKLMLDLDGTILVTELSRASDGIAKMKAKKGMEELKSGNLSEGVIDMIKGYVGGASGVMIGMEAFALKPFMGETSAENYANTTLHQIMSYFKVNRKEIEEAAENFLPAIESKRAKECIELIKKTGKPKKTILYTKSPSAFASVAAKHYRPDYLEVPNETQFNQDGTVKGLDSKVKRPQDIPAYLEEEAEKNHYELGDVIYVTNNDDDGILQGKVGLLVGYGNGKIKDNCDLWVKDWEDFESQLKAYYHAA